MPFNGLMGSISLITVEHISKADSEFPLTKVKGIVLKIKQSLFNELLETQADPQIGIIVMVMKITAYIFSTVISSFSMSISCFRILSRVIKRSSLKTLSPINIFYIIKSFWNKKHQNIS